MLRHLERQDPFTELVKELEEHDEERRLLVENVPSASGLRPPRYQYMAEYAFEEGRAGEGEHNGRLTYGLRS